MADPLLLIGTALAGGAAASSVSAWVQSHRLRRLRAKLAKCDIALAGLRHDDAQQRVLSRAILDDPGRLAVRFNAEGQATFVSPSCWSIAGCPPEHLLADGLSRMVHPNDTTTLNNMLMGLVPTMESRVRLIRADGRVVWLLLRREPVPEDGGQVMTLTDITQAVRTEDSLADARQTLTRMAMLDSLTGLPNRACFVADTDRAIASGQSVALFFIDLDRFKPMNDMHGHVIGDAILREIGSRLSRLSTDDLIAARLGADEFALLARADDGDQTLAERARQLIDTILAPIRGEAAQVDVSSTIGIAMSGRDGTNACDLLRAADIAMTHGKRSGGGCYRFFEARMGEELARDTELSRELPRAIENGEIVPYFQPLVRMKDAEIVGFEVLARWEHPTRGVLPPARFLDLVEKSGRSGAMFRALLAKSCMVARGWSRHVGLSINISPRELLDDSLPDIVDEILCSTGFDGRRLEVELTENALVDDCHQARDVLERLRALGPTVALDDFGTGFSSLFHLRELPIDKVKIDKSFMRALDTDAENARYVVAIVGLCHALGLEMTAEGVETEGTMRRLQEVGCTFGQGYLFGRPMPASDAGALLGTNRLPAMAAE